MPHFLSETIVGKWKNKVLFVKEWAISALVMGKKPEDPPFQSQQKKPILKARQMQEQQQEASHYKIVTDNFGPISL